MNELYEASMNRVVDYIQANLNEELSLKQLSEVACYSKFHFNRIFSDYMGESVYQYIKRLRLEKSAALLQGNLNVSITDVALVCGFENPSSFAKSFKNHFKMTATEWRNKSAGYSVYESTPVQIERDGFSINRGSPVWTYHLVNAIWQVAIEDIRPLTFAYLRKTGPYHDDEILYGRLYTRLLRWAAARELINEETIEWHIYHDDPNITEDKNLRVMVGIPVMNSVAPSGSVGISKISGGKFAVCRFLLKRDEFAGAWSWIFSEWLINSGYEWDDRESFERCHGKKIINGNHFFDVDICIPVKAV
ncbi:AraC family transcriptional regulator [Dethiosulfatarculus sandiegensis]|nr:AraC family transcriptional regulator [Dethiosulfatarculus sandiegensis]